MLRWSSLAALLFIGSPALLSADLLIVEKSLIKSGNRVIVGARSTYIKGTRMRIEVTQEGATTVTVYDLPAGESLELDASKRKAVVRTISTRSAKLEKEYPRARSTVTLTATGITKTTAGLECAEHRFDGRVPITKSGEIALLLSGIACLASADPRAADYATFAKAAYDQDLVLGRATDNAILLALVRGQTELYRALTQQGGIPLSVDLTTTVEGRGVLAGMVRKPLAGSRITTASKIEAATLDDALFAVPAGWKRELQK